MTPSFQPQFRPVLWLLALWSLLAIVPALAADRRDDDNHARPDKTLYVWASDQARVAPDFLAVINFDEDSHDY
jgi:hypothetical protein